MQKGSYVYSPKEGFGIIINIARTSYQIYFSNRGLQEKSELGLREIPEQIIKYVKDFNYGSFSLEYIRNISFGTYGITAEVLSNGTKRPSIYLDPIGNIQIRCSCTGKQPCRHVCALISNLKYTIKDLDDAYKEYAHLDELKKELKTTNPNALNLLIRNEYSVENNLNIIEELAKQNANYICTFFEYLSLRTMREDDRELLLKMIIANDSIRTQLYNSDNLIDKLDCGYSIKKLINKQKRNITKQDDSILNLIHEVVNKDSKSGALLFLNNMNYSPLIDQLIKYLFQKCTIDEDIIKKLETLNNEQINTFIFNYSSIQNKEILLKAELPFIIDYDYFKQQDEQTKYSIIKRLRLDNDAEVKELLKELKKSNNEQYKYKGLCVLKNYRTYYRFSNMIEQVLEDMKYANYLRAYINDMRELSSWMSRETYLPSNRKFYEGMDNYLFHYFTFGINGKVFEEDYSDRLIYNLYYMLVDACGNTVLSVCVYEDKKIRCLKNRIDGQSSSEIVEGFVHFANINHTQLINETRQQLIDKTIKLNNERKLEKLRNKIDIFDREYTEKNITLKEGRKAEIEYYFTFLEYYPKKYEYNLSLKIGVDKKYIVKDFLNFIMYFLNNQTIRYGKNFEFTHNLNNLVEKDKRIMKLLLDFFSNYDGSSNKTTTLNKYQLEKLLFLLKNEVVNINNDSYLIKLENIKLEIKINEKYEIELSMPEECILLELKDNIFILNKVTHCLDLLDCTQEEKQLILFAKDNQGLCIENVKEDFKDKIYSRYSESIKIADNLKEEFKVGMLEIETYFDYDEKKISYITKYLIDNSEIKEEDLKKSSDIRKNEDYKNILENYGFKKGVLSDDSFVMFFNRDFSDLKKFSKVFLSESIKDKQLVHFTPAKIQISYKNNLMSAFMDESKYSNSELEEIVKAFKKKKKYVLLKDNRIVDFTNPEVKKFVDIIDDLGLNPKKLKNDNRISITQGLKALAYENNVKVDDYLKKMIEDISDFKNDKTPLPTVNATLRQYQIEGYHWLKNICKYNIGGILADDMGLGKTLEIITLIASDDTPKPNLIVCPKSLIFNWRNEFERFTPFEKVVEIYGSKKQREEIISSIKEDEKVNYITSYDSLRNDIEEYKTKINIMIIDEAQYIKNVNALKTQTVKQIDAVHKIALTGTPIENNIIDLWSIFDFIMPGYFESLEKFKSKYNSNEEFVHIVAKRIAPFVLRRTKGNVQKDLPEKFERILTAEMGEEQRKVYDAFRKKAKDALSAGNAKAFDMLPYLTRLRQICVDPAMFFDDYKGSSAKFDTLCELVEEYLKEGHRILIFSQFVKALENVEKRLNLPCFKITGDVDSKQRHEICEKFNSGSEENIVLISLKAGGTGLNLTGADVVVHLDPWWNVSAENQASDRSHRIGQTKNVEVIKLICEDSIEQRVIELQNKKKDLIDEMISNDESTVVSANIEDIKFMLQ